MLDMLIRNGTLIDGTGSPRFTADLGVVGDRITALGNLDGTRARRIIDATGKIVAPGFIDVHNHSEGWLLRTSNFVPKTTQGFTTEILMLDGISYAPVDEWTWPQWFHYLRSLDGLRFQDYSGWRTIDEFMGLLHRRTAQNTLAHIPYGNVRAMATGFGKQPMDDFQMREIIGVVETAMDDGAVGLSTGMDYVAQCFADTDELVEVCRAMAPWGGLYVSHVRYMKGTLKGIREAVEIGRRAQVPVHISHMKASSTEEIDAILDYVDRVALNEVDFSFDVYPYLPGCTMLSYMLPFEAFEQGPLGVLPRLTDPALRSRFADSLATYPLDRIHIAWLGSSDNAEHIGTLLSEYVAAVGTSPAEALADLLIEENLAVLLVFHHGDDALVEPFLAHERYMMGTDGIYFPHGAVHPRLYGSAPRLVGPCVRDRHLFSLEQAVRKLSGYPAERFGVRNRGILAQGRFADIVVLDPETVTDHATYRNPHQISTGIEEVLVNGVPVVSQGVPVTDFPGPAPGRYLRYQE